MARISESLSASSADAAARHWFCAGVLPTGEVFKKEAESPASILEIIDRSSFVWIDYWADDFKKCVPVAAAQFSFSDMLISSLTGESYSTYEDLDTEMGVRLPSIQVAQFEVNLSPLFMLLKRNFVFTIHPQRRDRRFARLRRYSETVLRKIPRDIPVTDRITMLLTRLVDENNEINFDELRKIEERGDQLHESLTNPQTPREIVGPQIYQMKHALITYLDALWETVDVINALRYGDAELMSDDPVLLNRLGLLAEDVNRQIGLAEHMSEVLASGLEVLQSIYNNQLQALNNRLALVMTYLTILGTAVLVPNTLATVFSNSAFNLGPEDIGWYVALIVGSTILATALAYWWVKRKGWLPKKID